MTKNCFVRLVEFILLSEQDPDVFLLDCAQSMPEEYLPGSTTAAIAAIDFVRFYRQKSFYGERQPMHDWITTWKKHWKIDD